MSASNVAEPMPEDADELNKLCSKYGTGIGATGSRSVTIEDINKITKYNNPTYEQEISSGKKIKYGEKITVYWDGTDKPYYETEGKVTGNFATSHKAFLYYEGNSVKVANKSETAKSDAMEKICTLKQTYYTYKVDKSSINSDLYNLLFDDDSKAEYYLASMYTKVTANYISYGLRTVRNGSISDCDTLFSDANGAGILGVGARVVVSLMPDIKLNGSGTDGYTII